MQYSFNASNEDRIRFMRAYPKTNYVDSSYVYALKEPGNPAIQYVGITNHPLKRLRHHRVAIKDTAKCRWIARVGADNLIMEVLVRTDLADAIRIERDLVAHLDLLGKPTRNSQIGCKPLRIAFG